MLWRLLTHCTDKTSLSRLCLSSHLMVSCCNVCPETKKAGKYSVCVEEGGCEAGHCALRYVCLSSADVEKAMKANGLREPPEISAQRQVQHVVLVVTAVVVIVFNTPFHNYTG